MPATAFPTTPYSIALNTAPLVPQALGVTPIPTLPLESIRIRSAPFVPKAM